MIHSGSNGSIGDPLDPQLKQVEFNTYSVAGGAHSDKTAEMHQWVWPSDHTKRT